MRSAAPPSDPLAATLARAVAARGGRAGIAGGLRPAPLTRPVLARFEPGEHVRFGRPGPKVTVAGIELEERYLIAMADFYKDPEALMREQTENLKRLMDLIDRDERTRAANAPEADLVTEKEWTDWSKASGHKEGERYMDLNAKNEAHFEGLNWRRWLDLHTRALRLAQAAGRGSGIVSNEARIINGFANHFLTDAFSAGHLVNKVTTKKRAKPSIDNKANRQRLAREIARGMLADPAVRARLEREEIKDMARPGLTTWGPAANETQLYKLLESVLYWTASVVDQAFLSVPVKLAHDELNQAIKSGHGPRVYGVIKKSGGPLGAPSGDASSTVDSWQLPGDTALAADKTGLTLKYGRGAVQATIDNLKAAAGTTQPLDTDEINRMVRRVLEWLPVTGRAADQQVQAAVDKAVDISNPQTRARIVELSVKEFPTAIEQFYERKLMQPLGTDARQQAARRKQSEEAMRAMGAAMP